MPAPFVLKVFSNRSVQHCATVLIKPRFRHTFCKNQENKNTVNLLYF